MILSPPELSQRKERIVFLDYLRVFAFSSVLIGHKFFSDLQSLIDQPWLHQIPKTVLKLFLPFVDGGGAGVVVFFLVSGYIISSVLEKEPTPIFLIKRFFRIYPLYVSAVFLQYLFLLRGGLAPNLECLARQLSLLGDLWETPYSLAGVEWTLRVEVVFYLLISIVKSLGFLNKRKRALPFVVLALILCFQLLSPIPQGLFTSYFTTYSPFLWLGVLVFFLERKIISWPVFLAFLGVVSAQYYYNISTYQPAWLHSFFAICGLLVFFVFWCLRTQLRSNRYLLLLSELTFSVYLFHNWLFDYFVLGFNRLGLDGPPPAGKILSVFPLLGFCYFSFRYIEKPSVRVGKRLAAKVQKAWEEKNLGTGQRGPSIANQAAAETDSLI